MPKHSSVSPRHRRSPAGSTPPGWPQPLRDEAFHGLAGKIVRTIEPHTEADPAALLLQFLVVFGNVVGRSPFFPVERDHHHTNLYAVLVGETSRSRKGTSASYVTSLFAAVPPPPVSLSPSDCVADDLVDQTPWEPVRERNGLSSGEGLIFHIRDAMPTLEKHRHPDPGVADKRMLVVESEFASALRVLERPGNTLSPTVRNAWDGKDVLTTLTKNTPVRATGGHISIIGHVSKDELVRYLSRTEAGNGFGNRFLWGCVRRSKILPRGGGLCEEDFQALAKQVVRAVKAARRVTELDFDEDADHLWTEVYPTLSADRPGLHGAVTARAEAQVLRLASICTLFDKKKVVSVDHLRAALALWQYCDDSARFVFGDRVGDPDADKIWNALRESDPSGLTRTNIRDLFGRNQAKGQVDRALEVLARHGLAHCETEKGRGPATTRWYATDPRRYDLNDLDD